MDTRQKENEFIAARIAEDKYIWEKAEELGILADEDVLYDEIREELQVAADKEVADAEYRAEELEGELDELQRAVRKFLKLLNTADISFKPDPNCCSLVTEKEIHDAYNKLEPLT